MRTREKGDFVGWGDFWVFAYRTTEIFFVNQYEKQCRKMRRVFLTVSLKLYFPERKYSPHLFEYS